MQRADEEDSRYESLAQVVRVAEAFCRNGFSAERAERGKDQRF
jgi:hypothetical protein